jgi:superfamily II DNA or RNA helicase
MEKFIHTKHRIGTTGTLDDSKINELSLRGLMGPTYKVISTKELMDAGQISKLKIKCLVLQYPEHLRKELKGIDYQNEINFIVANEKRNKIIRDLALSCKGNTLILFNYVERHGKVIFDLINAKISEGRKVYFVFGGTEAGEREEIRRILDSEKDAIVVAGTKIFSTGANIPSIENVIFAMPSKSTITIRQSIGRGLRLRKGKTHMTLFDISDDLSYKNFRNSGMKHLEERVNIYTKEQFEYQFINIPL